MKKLLLAQPMGFCAGVVRAINTVNMALKKWGPPIYVKHEIVHNRHIIDDFCKKGVVFIEDLETVPEGSKFIYSAHGISPEVRDIAKKRNLLEIDATCGLVTKIHSAVKRFYQKGFKIVLIGHKNHVEIIGIKGEVPEVFIVETVDDVKSLPFSSDEPVFYITQTTLSLDDVEPISQAILRRYAKAQTLPSSSMCYATVNRQRALTAILNVVDLVIVIGDIQSSNSTRLCELGLRRGIPSYLINDVQDLHHDFLKDVNVVGLTAGASSPEYLIRQCIERLFDLGVTSVQDAIYTQEDVFFQLPKEVFITN